MSSRIPYPARPDGLKMCERCGEELPADSSYFDRDATKDDGFKPICKGCRAGERQKKQDVQISEHVKMMDEAALQALRAMGRGGSDVPHAAEVLQHIMNAFGGPQGFAIHFMNQYLSAAPGSTVRTKMIGEVFKIVTKVSDSGAAQIPIDLMEDEDVARVFKEQTLKIAGNVNRNAEKAS